MSEETTLEVDGQVLRLGCLVPDSRPENFVAHSQKAKIHNKDTVARIINNPKRRAGRDFWSPNWIYQQGRVGSCNGCAAAKSLQKARVINGSPPQVLSGEFIYAHINRDRSGRSRDVGSMLDDGMMFLQSDGTCLEENVPHQTWDIRNIRPENVAEAQRFLAGECHRVDDEEELASGIASGFVGVIAVHFAREMMRYDSDGVAYESNGPGNHAVHTDNVRINNRGEYEFDMVNSHGREYCQDGRVWITWRKHLRETVKRHCFYLIRATELDKGGRVPPKLKTAA